jgi:putative endonuclease
VLHPDQIIAVYIMASGRNGTLYTGMTTDLSRRIYEHRERAREGFTKRYGCTRLVWWERFELITAAISRERTIKGYPRAWKLNLIEAENPEWEDLYERLNW